MNRPGCGNVGVSSGPSRTINLIICIAAQGSATRIAFLSGQRRLSTTSHYRLGRRLASHLSPRIDLFFFSLIFSGSLVCFFPVFDLFFPLLLRSFPCPHVRRLPMVRVPWPLGWRPGEKLPRHLGALKETGLFPHQTRPSVALIVGEANTMSLGLYSSPK